MSAEKRILNVLGQVDERYIEEAASGAAFTASVPLRHSKRRLAAMMAAAILALLLMGAGIVAVVYGGSIQSWFGHYWEAMTGQTMSDGHAAVIDHLSQEIAIAHTVDGITVTVDSATVGDDTFFLLMRVEGMEFSKKCGYGFDEVSMEVKPDPLENSGGLGSYGFQYLGLDGDGAALLMLDYGYASSDGFMADNSPLEVTLTLKNFLQSAYTDKERLLAEGEWNMVFSLDRSVASESVKLSDSEVMAMDLDKRELVPIKISNIELTDTGLRFQYDYADGTLSLEAHISAELENGLNVQNGGGNATPSKEGNILNCSYQWSVPLNLDEVIAIQIGETKIDVP